MAITYTRLTAAELRAVKERAAAEGRIAARKRVAAILGHPLADACADVADFYTFETDLPAAEVIGRLRRAVVPVQEFLL